MRPICLHYFRAIDGLWLCDICGHTKRKARAA
jgi:hypothetical protein